MCNTAYKINTEDDAPDLKHLFKIALHELKEEVPTFIKFFVFVISMTVSKAVL